MQPAARSRNSHRSGENVCFIEERRSVCAGQPHHHSAVLETRVARILVGCAPDACVGCARSIWLPLHAQTQHAAAVHLPLRLHYPRDSCHTRVNWLSPRTMGDPPCLYLQQRVTLLQHLTGGQRAGTSRAPRAETRRQCASEPAATIP